MKLLLTSDTSIRARMGSYTPFSTSSELVEILKSTEGENVECMVIHSSDYTEYETGMLINEAKEKGVDKFIYINEKPSRIIASYIEGIGGIIETSEDLLEEDSIDYILDSYGDFTSSYSLSVVDSVSVIDDFVSGFFNRDSKINNEVYLERVKFALAEIKETSQRAELITQEISEEVIELFNEVIDTTSKLTEVCHKLKQSNIEVQQRIAQDRRFSVKPVQFSWFPTYTYNGGKTVLHIKEKADCKYLLSFLIYYTKYLQGVKKKKVKMVVCHKDAKDLNDRYINFTNISDSTIHNKKLTSRDYISTNQPKSEVFNVLMGDTEDIIIVLDRMWQKESIIKGTRVKSIYATSGVGAMRREKIKENKCILSGVSTENLFIGIPHIENYPENDFLRTSAYFSTCQEYYEKLDKLLDI